MSIPRGYQPIDRSAPAIAAVPAMETHAQKARRLMAEAKAEAAAQVADLTARLASLAAVAEDIAGGGDAYRAGVRDIAGRLAAELKSQAQTIDAIQDRSPS